MPLDLLSYSEFGRMRLGFFVPPDIEIVEQSDFEWMQGLWLHEGIGFTWFGRLMEQSDDTAGLELLFEELDGTSIGRILKFMHLPVAPGMQFEHLRDLFGWPVTTGRARKVPLRGDAAGMGESTRCESASLRAQ